ncbi:aminoacyl-tRNA hydrolase [Texcoconibacillus texcoconensis]|nr:aminoacyl-tRNA hydrolase [Texcoconibacillus texcoconensis]
MKLIVGLGNPGKKYAGTRHNIGFEVLDQCEKKLGIPFEVSKFQSSFGYRYIEGEKVFLQKPLTYMNLSGQAVRPLIDYFNIDVEDVLVVYDDLDLPPGTIRLRQKGGHGGHNGIRSLIDQLGTNEFKRIRVGIGRPPEGQTVVDHVLRTFAKSERPDVDHSIETATAAIERWMTTNFTNVMNDFN